MKVSNDCSPDVAVDKGLGNLKMFSEDIEPPIASDEADKRDRSIGDIVQLWQFELWRQHNRDKPGFLDHLDRGFAFEAAVAMISVVKELEAFGLGSEMPIVTKPLGSEEPSVIRIIEALHGSITPRFPNGDEDHFDTQQKTEPQHNAKGSRVTIASPKTELVVDLEKVGNSHDLPAANQAQSHGLIVFSPLGMKRDPVAVKIHDIE